MKKAIPNPADEAAEKALVVQILDSSKNGEFVSTTLRTDERVIARVTDGIYRRPGSALRELISNAYDADATRVVIKTDAPRFERITVEDNGHGMSPEVLAHMLFHIGGSAKRSMVGQAMGITSAQSRLHSPGGRRLIGKIGIGLFSVSQLTHSFQVITKVKGDKFRTVATDRSETSTLTIKLKISSPAKRNMSQGRSISGGKTRPMLIPTAQQSS